MSTSLITFIAQGTVPPFLLEVPTQLASNTLAYAPAPNPPRMTHPLPKASTTWLGIWPGSPLLVPAEPRFRSRNARTWSTPMAGRSELPSGKPSSFRRTELRLGEPEPPAKKRIIDVAVLVEPCQLARVSGYRASVRCSLPPAGVFSESGLGALWQAFARSLSGRRRQGRRWLEWLPMACRQGSAAARRWLTAK